MVRAPLISAIGVVTLLTVLIPSKKHSLSFRIHSNGSRPSYLRYRRCNPPYRSYPNFANLASRTNLFRFFHAIRTHGRLSDLTRLFHATRTLHPFSRPSLLLAARCLFHATHTVPHSSRFS